MKNHIPLGAIDKITGDYVFPRIATKKSNYVCPECKKDLILCQGNIRTHHFRHKHDDNPCEHYNNPGESEIHKDAKQLLKTLLERKIPISFIRKCDSCEYKDEFDIPEIDETSEILLEHRFDFNGPKIADVAYIDNNDIICIFEICYKHQTRDENRPEPWFEIDALSLITDANEKTTELKIECIRSMKCQKCVFENMNKEQLCDFILNKLGYVELDNETVNAANKMDNTNDYPHPYSIDYQISFNCCDEGKHTLNCQCKKVIELFEEHFYDQKVVIHQRKGQGTAYIMPKEIYSESFWEDAGFWYDDDVDGQILIGYDSVDCDAYGTNTALFLCEIINACKFLKKYLIEKRKIKLPNPKYIKYLYETDEYGDDEVYSDIIDDVKSGKYVYLSVDYSKKDLIKDIGGKWNSNHKLWYLPIRKYNKCSRFCKDIGNVIFWSRCDWCDGSGLSNGGACHTCFNNEY